jgi:hypothetical protein
VGLAGAGGREPLAGQRPQGVVSDSEIYKVLGDHFGKVRGCWRSLNQHWDIYMDELVAQGCEVVCDVASDKGSLGVECSELI